ncbi:MAG: ABC transporter permease [Planctomycetes bacterium]|nr:ABC transporter permease [Planctomycetota bacterium]
MWFISLVFKNLWHRKIRSILTCTSMAVAVCAVLSMLGTAEGYEQSFAALYEARGTDLVITQAGKAQRIASNLDESLIGRIAKIPGVKAVEGTLVDLASFPEANVVYFFGLDPSSVLVEGSKIKEGRPLTAADRRKVAIGRTLARNLGKKLGDSIEYLGEAFEVIAIFESYNLLESNGGVIPLKEMQEFLGKGKITTVIVILNGDYKSPEKVAEVRKNIDALRDPVPSEHVGYAVLQDIVEGENARKTVDDKGVERLVITEYKGGPEKKERLKPRIAIEDDQGKQLATYPLAVGATVAVRAKQKVDKGTVLAMKPLNIDAQATRDHISSNMETQTMKGLAWASSFIAMLIGFVSMLNTMMMSISERIREIATFRAIGWRKHRIMQMIFMEAFLLSAIGALLGIALAVPLMEFLANFSMTSSLVVSRITLETFFKGVGMGLFAGLLGAFYPAIIAANLSPASALRHE